MSQRENKTKPSRQWLMKMAELEDTAPSVAVGGLAERLGMLSPRKEDYPRILSRLVKLARRRLGFSVETLAETARVDLAELVRIEDDDAFQPSIRTVYQLADVLKLPAEKLLALAGLVDPKPDKVLSEAAILFAARSETNAKLTRSENDALDAFVKVLTEGND